MDANGTGTFEELIDIDSYCSIRMNHHEHMLPCAWKGQRHFFEAFSCNSMFVTASKFYFVSSRLDDFAVRSLPKIQRLIWRLDDFG